MGQVHVDVVDQAGIDLLAAGRIGLVGQAQPDAVGLGQRAVELRRGRSAGPQADAEILALLVGGLHAARQRAGNELGIAGAGEAAHAHIRARGDELRGLFGRHDLGSQCGIEDTGALRHVIASGVVGVRGSAPPADATRRADRAWSPLWCHAITGGHSPSGSRDSRRCSGGDATLPSANHLYAATRHISDAIPAGRGVSGWGESRKTTCTQEGMPPRRPWAKTRQGAGK